MQDELTHIGSLGRQNAVSINHRFDSAFQPLKVQILAVLSNTPCLVPSNTIEAGVPKAMAQLMAEQIIQEFHEGWKTLSKGALSANIGRKVAEWKKYAIEVIPATITS